MVRVGVVGVGIGLVRGRERRRKGSGVGGSVGEGFGGGGGRRSVAVVGGGHSRGLVGETVGHFGFSQPLASGVDDKINKI